MERRKAEFFLIGRHRILAKVNDAQIRRDGVSGEEFTPRSRFPFTEVTERLVGINFTVSVAVETVLVRVQIDVPVDEWVDGPAIFVQIPRCEPVLETVVHPITIGVWNGRVGHAEHDFNEGVGRLALLPSVEVVQEPLTSRFFRDEDVEHTLSLLGGLLEITVDVEQRCVTGMVDAVVGLFGCQRKFLAVDQTVFIAVKVSIAGDERIQCPRGRRHVPCRKEQLDTVQHPVAVRIDVVRIGCQARKVGLVFREEIAEGGRGWDARPLLECVGHANGGDEPLGR